MSEGVDPDPRFTLANERTFLAWIRTSLALVAGGVAVIGLDLPIQHAFVRAASIILILLGILAPVQAWWGWLRTEHAMRMSRSLPHPALTPVLVIGLTIAGLLLGVGSVLG